MKTKVLNQQKTVTINPSTVKKLTDKLSLFLERADPDTLWKEVTLVITDDAGIMETNHRFFGKHQPTDVISFRYDPIPGEEPGTTGDLLVNIDCAMREGGFHAGPDHELALYIAHGFDHLSGSEDDTPQKKEAMLQTETQWLETLQTECKNLIVS